MLRPASRIIGGWARSPKTSISDELTNKRDMEHSNIIILPSAELYIRYRH